MTWKGPTTTAGSPGRYRAAWRPPNSRARRSHSVSSVVVQRSSRKCFCHAPDREHPDSAVGRAQRHDDDGSRRRHRLARSTLMANMPPQRFNYQQRVGRAGRADQVFSYAVTVCRDRTHDDDYFTPTRKNDR